MLFLFGLILFIIGAGFFVGSAALWAWAEAEEFREPRYIICPETLQLTEVKVDGAYAARTALAGHEQLRLTACSRWPERQGCDQACAPQVPLVGDDRSFTQFAPFGLQPRSLRIFNPVRMSRERYASLAPELARRRTA